MATTLTFTGTVDPDWIDAATDAPDPRRAGVQAVLSLAGRGGAVVLVQWADGREPDDGYLSYWRSRADSLGMTPGPAEIDPDVTVAEYDVVQAASSGLNQVKGVPCMLRRRA